MRRRHSEQARRPAGNVWSCFLGLVLILSAAHCGDHGRRYHRDGGASSTSRVINQGRKGPLTVNKPSGGFAVDHPPGVTGRWSATFEDFVLCVTDPSTSARIQDVGYAVVPGKDPVSFTPMLRTFNLERVRSASPKHRKDFATYFGALLGQPPYRQSYAADFGGAGRYTRKVSGAVIDQGCDEANVANSLVSGGRVPAASFTELVFVMRAGARGAAVRKAWVDYVADGVRRRLLIRWNMVMCGSATRRSC